MHGRKNIKLVKVTFTELKASMKGVNRYVVLFCASTDFSVYPVQFQRALPTGQKAQPVKPS